MENHLFSKKSDIFEKSKKTKKKSKNIPKKHEKPKKSKKCQKSKEIKNLKKMQINHLFSKNPIFFINIFCVAKKNAIHLS